MDYRQISYEELQRKQSVRATFKLPEEVIVLLGLIAGQLGIKQKSLLDELLGDTTTLDILAQEAGGLGDGGKKRRQKTYVLSRSSLKTVTDIAKGHHVPRDLLVEMSIRRLLPLIESELKKHDRRKIIGQEMQRYLRWGENLRDKAGKLLGEKDEVYSLLDKQVHLAQKDMLMVDSIIEKGMPMENW